MVGEVHANSWGPKFYIKSIFGACEFTTWTKIQHFGSINLKKEESWNFVLVSKILDSIFQVAKTLGLINRGQQTNSGMDPSPY